MWNKLDVWCIILSECALGMRVRVIDHLLIKCNLLLHLLMIQHQRVLMTKQHSLIWAIHICTGGTLQLHVLILLSLWRWNYRVLIKVPGDKLAASDVERVQLLSLVRQRDHNNFLKIRSWLIYQSAIILLMDLIIVRVIMHFCIPRVVIVDLSCIIEIEI